MPVRKMAAWLRMPTILPRKSYRLASAAFLLLVATTVPRGALGGKPDFATSGTLEAKSLKLPEVGDVLSKATVKIKDLAKHTEAVYKRVADQEEENKAFLKQRKQQFEHNLTQQAERNNAIIKQREATRKYLAALEATNAIRRQHVDELQHRVELMRTTFDALRGKLGMAKDFVDESLKVTNVSNAEEMSVLQPPKPRPSLKRLLAATGSADQQPHGDVAVAPGQAVTLLQVVSSMGRTAIVVPPARKVSPESYLEVLQNSLNGMRGEQEHDIAELTANFTALLSRSDAFYTKVKAEKDELRSKVETQEKYAGQLDAAASKLQKVHGDLNARLNGLAFFAEQLKATASKAISVIEEVKEPRELNETKKVKTGSPTTDAAASGGSGEGAQPVPKSSRQPRRGATAQLLQESQPPTSWLFWR